MLTLPLKENCLSHVKENNKLWGGALWRNTNSMSCFILRIPQQFVMDWTFLGAMLPPTACATLKH